MGLHCHECADADFWRWQQQTIYGGQFREICAQRRKCIKFWHLQKSFQPNIDSSPGTCQPTRRHLDLFTEHGATTTIRSLNFSRCTFNGITSLPRAIVSARKKQAPIDQFPYTFLAVPGLFAGTSLWWRSQKNLFNSRTLRNIWAGYVALSLIFAIAGNQNRSFSFLIPDKH